MAAWARPGFKLPKEWSRLPQRAEAVLHHVSGWQVFTLASGTAESSGFKVALKIPAGETASYSLLGLGSSKPTGIITFSKGAAKDDPANRALIVRSLLWLGGGLFTTWLAFVLFLDEPLPWRFLGFIPIFAGPFMIVYSWFGLYGAYTGILVVLVFHATPPEGGRSLTMSDPSPQVAVRLAGGRVLGLGRPGSFNNRIRQSFTDLNAERVIKEIVLRLASASLPLPTS